MILPLSLLLTGGSSDARPLMDALDGRGEKPNYCIKRSEDVSPHMVIIVTVLAIWVAILKLNGL